PSHPRETYRWLPRWTGGCAAHPEELGITSHGHLQESVEVLLAHEREETTVGRARNPCGFCRLGESWRANDRVSVGAGCQIVGERRPIATGTKPKDYRSSPASKRVRRGNGRGPQGGADALNPGIPTDGSA